MITYETILNNLRAEAQDKGLTQLEIAKKMDVDKALVSRWMNGVHEVQVSTLLKLCEAIGVNPKKIFSVPRAAL